MDRRSTGHDAIDELLPNPPPHEDEAEVFQDDKTSSGGSDTVVPEALESKNDYTSPHL